jgi:hypothetical protein
MYKTTITYIAVMWNFEVISGKFNKEWVLEEIMQRNGSLTCIIINV